LANIDPVLQRKTIAQFNSPQLVILDSMNFWIENSYQELLTTLEQIDVLIINDQEIRQLTKEDNLIKAMDIALTLGPKRVIVKKGEHGSIMCNGSDYFLCPAVPLKTVVDPTGAGDSFAGGFAGYLASCNKLSEEAFRKAVIIGTLISASTVQGFSTETIRSLSRSDIEEKYEEWQKYMHLPSKLF